MSLYLLLLALQAEAPLDSSPPKAKPAATKAKPAAPKVNPTIIYTPATKPDEAAASTDAAAEAEAPAAIGLSEPALKRILAERKANAERQTAHRKELAATQEAVEEALAAEPFDLAALKAALVRRDQVNTTYREKLTEAVLAMLEAVPAEERLAVAKAVIKGEVPARAAEAATQPKPSPRPSPVGR